MFFIAIEIAISFCVILPQITDVSLFYANAIWGRSQLLF